MRISVREHKFFWRIKSEICAGVAQLVEQRIRNAKVGCSIPLTGTISLN